MTNKILGLSVLVALIGALTFLTLPLYRILVSNESNVVYAQEQQQLQTGADDPMKYFSGADWSLKVNINGLSPQSAPVTDLQVQASPTHLLFRILETTLPYLLLTEIPYV